MSGATPFGYIAGKLTRGIDIRQHGSGNIGATNAIRVLGNAIATVGDLLSWSVLAELRAGLEKMTEWVQRNDPARYPESADRALGRRGPSSGPSRACRSRRLRVDGDTGGRKAFHAASTFGNPDVAAITTRFREHAAKLGFEIVAAEPVAVSVLPKNDFASEKALSDFVTPMCGEGVAERMWLGFQAIDKASQLIAKNDPNLGIPAPDMLLRHLNSKKSLPDWLTEAKTFYATAMNEMYRANTRAREGSRTFTLYNAKRLEFTFHYISAIESLYKSHDAATRSESLEAAMDSIYNALNSWSDVARDSSDRGAIALLNEYGYRPLVKVVKGRE